MTTAQIIFIVIAVAITAAALSSLITSRKMRSKVAYMLDALEDKELNFRFDEKRLRGRRFNRTLNRLRNIFDRERHEIIEQEKYFGLMLDHVRTGVVVMDGSGHISYCNKTALTLLGIATFSHIRQLRIVSETLYDAFINVSEDKQDQTASYYRETGRVTVSISAARATIAGNEIKIITFNDISNEIAENEQQSWSKLIRVLTHEIMNTVTPIASLSETLLKFDKIEEPVLSGLNTISQSSRSLIRFVENYRNLTRVATPVKKAFYFRDMAERIINLTADQAVLVGADCRYTELTEDVLIYGDEGQISQIIINLVRNALQAEAKNIEITAEINPSEHVIINVQNDGMAISKNSHEEIFVPFYTTKPDGTGIGLSLSRQIMHLHNGSLTLTRSDEKLTVFTLTFR